MKTSWMLLLSMTMAVTGLCAATEPPFDLTTNLGETYKQCHVIKITPEAVTVVHDAGVTKVRFALLSDAWKKKYNYSPAKAKLYVKAEARRKKAAEAATKATHRKWEQQEEARMALLEKSEKQWLASLPAPVTAVLPPAADDDGSFDAGIPYAPPLHQVYTPNLDRSYRIGYHSGAGLYNDTSGYSYGYGGYPSYYIPPVFPYYRGHHGTGSYCPPFAGPGDRHSPFPASSFGARNGGFSGRFGSGGATFRVQR